VSGRFLCRMSAKATSSNHRAYPQFLPLMVELARNAVKEKVVRIVLATFRVGVLFSLACCKLNG